MKTMCKFSRIVLHLFTEPWYFTVDLCVISDTNAVICKSIFSNIVPNYAFHIVKLDEQHQCAVAAAVGHNTYYIWHRPYHHVYMVDCWLATIICHLQIDITLDILFFLAFLVIIKNQIHDFSEFWILDLILFHFTNFLNN